jgi:hypothetical protein
VADWAGILGDARAVVEASGAAEAARFLTAWPRHGPHRGILPATLPVVQWLRPAAAQAPPGPLGALARAIAAAADDLGWRQTYRADDVPASFLARYGWCELLGRDGPVPCTALAGGLLLLGPDTHYPSHRHAAEELYVPLSGVACWQRGRADFEAHRPGEAIVHASGEPHAVRTGAEPLLALYVWRGAGLEECATLAVDPHRR